MKKRIIIKMLESKHDRKKFFDENPKFEFTNDGMPAGNFEKILAECTNCRVRGASFVVDSLDPKSRGNDRWYDYADDLTPDEVVERVIQATSHPINYNLIVGYSLGYRVVVFKREKGVVEVHAYYSEYKPHGHFFYGSPPMYLRTTKLDHI